MKTKAILLLSFIGLSGLMLSCETEQDKVFLLEDPIKPAFVELPDLTLSAANKADTLVFKCSPVDLGFRTSSNYFVEACGTGLGFTPASNVIRVYFGAQDTLIKVTEEALNKLFVKKFPAGTPAPIDFRIRAVIVVDAGTGALGSTANKYEVISEITTATISTY